MAVAMMTLAVGMQVFRVIHHAHFQVKASKLAVRLQRKRKPRAVVLPAGPRSDLNAAQRKGRLMFIVVQPIGRPTVVMVELFLIVTSDRP
jgi:hypothetical protein